MRRREWLGGTAATLIATAARPQSSRSRPLVGVLITTPLTAGMSARTVAILRDELSRLHHADGERITLDVKSAEGDPGLLAGLAKGLVEREAAVLCAFGPAAVRAARDATRTIPIVALDLETDPVQAGWVSSFARPATNITGLFQDLAMLSGKWLELLRAAAPRARRIAVVWDTSTGSAQLDAMRQVADRWKLELGVIDFASSAQLERALQRRPRSPADAMALLSSPIVRNSSRELADYAVEARLPAISPFRPFAEFGGLMAYGPDLDHFFRRCAAFVVKVLSGAPPGDIPIEQPTKFEMVLNVKAAEVLGLSLPQELLVRADALLR